MHFPELLAAPFITKIMFGPQDIFWCGKSQSILRIKMKRKLTWCSVLVSVTGQVVSLPTTFLLHFYLPYYTAVFPPSTVLVCLGMLVVSLYVLIHLDDWVTSDIPFLAPLYCYDIQLSAQGIKYNHNWSRNNAMVVTKTQIQDKPACEDRLNTRIAISEN